MRDWEDKNRIY
jgi:hypothetical protein